MKMSRSKKEAQKWMLEISKRLGFETLETRNSDDLDFQQVAVWRMKEALEAAYAAGKAAR